MKIHNQVYLVGSGKAGMNVSNSMDCNVYLLGGKKESALIDAGSGIEPDRIVHNIETNGFSMENIKYLFLTHIHGDHAAGAAYFKEKYGMKLVIAEEATDWYEKGNMDKTSINRAIAAGVYPKDFEYPTCSVDYSVKEGDKFKIGEIELEIINTPGHSKGHISFLWKDSEDKNNLFSGDAVFAGGKIVLQNIWDCSITEYSETMNKFDRLGIDRLFPGHGPFLISDAFNDIKTACDYFAKLSIPPNL